MSDRLDILMNSDRKGIYIPLGRQLPRTPPFQDPTKRLDFDGEQQLTEINNKENQDPSKSGFKTPPVKDVSSDDPQSMLKGMKGYQLTPADMEFMQKMKEEKELKKLQDDLKEVYKLLKSEMMALELAVASKERAEAEMHQLPSCEEIRALSEVVLELNEPSTELEELDTKSLLALVTKQNALKALKERKREIGKLQDKISKKRRENDKDKDLLKKQIAVEQSKIQGMMNKLSELKTELARQLEANETKRVELLPVINEETKVKETGRVKAKDKKAPPNNGKAQDGVHQSKPSRRAANHKTVVKDEVEKTKMTKSTAATQNIADTVPQEATVRSKRKLTASDPQPKTQKKVVEPKPTSEPAAPTRRRKKSGASSSVSANEGEQNTVVRRSKRIASRK